MPIASLEDARRAVSVKGRAIWQAFGWLSLAASTGCGTAFKDAPRDASTTDVAPSDGSPKDAGGDADAPQAIEADGANAACPDVRPELCRAYIDYEYACGYYEPCVCTYWTDNCAMLANHVTMKFYNELLVCGELSLKTCPLVSAVEDCAYGFVAGLERKGLTGDQSMLLTAYCAMCPGTSVSGCEAAAHPFAGEYDDPTTSAITSKCTGPGKSCDDFGMCVSGVLRLTLSTCVDAGS
jgi:hypothetical protein